MMAPCRVSLREIRRRAERAEQRARERREREWTRSLPPPPEEPPQRTVTGNDNYIPQRPGMGPLLEIPMDAVCRYCQAEGVRVWEEKPMQSTWVTVLMLVGCLLTAACRALPVLVLWLCLLNTRHYHSYCPACGANWLGKRREQSS